jgi:hypothetical protein
MGSMKDGSVSFMFFFKNIKIAAHSLTRCNVSGVGHAKTNLGWFHFSQFLLFQAFCYTLL